MNEPPAASFSGLIDLAAASFGGRAVECPGAGLFPQTIGAARVRRQECFVCVPLFEEVAMDRQRHRQVGSRTHRQVKVRLSGQRRRPRIDDDQLRATSLRLTDVRNQMNT